MLSRGNRLLATTAAVAALLVFAAVALAAHPKAGKRYAGTTSGPVVNTFAPPVSFKVSKNGKRLLSFTYSTFGCSGFGGKLTPGVNYYLKPYALQKLGSIAVASNGTFSVKNVKRSRTVQGQTTTTTSSVKGKFKNAKTATGTITFSQKFHIPGSTVPPCGPVTVTFTAKEK